MAVHCPECGFVNDEGANYCQKCGAFLGQPEPAAEESTATYRVDDETGEIQPVQIEDVVADTGAALVIRAGGGRTGESFPLETERLTVGRRPESDIFLDDVTVSRRHAEFHRETGMFTVRDVGSLNGTYVNRERVESATLSNGDEVQIGKFRLVFIAGPRTEDQ
jgi:pSer/pThr/pTyr-binding forkhead associated (FHA) protein